jgi:hypothetical protein
MQRSMEQRRKGSDRKRVARYQATVLTVICYLFE